MITVNCKLRIAYCDSDKMGIVHHSNYAKYCEQARMVFFREIGLPYANIESKGIIMPVISMNFKFIKPAHFDEIIEIETHYKKLPGIKMLFTYNVFNESHELINQAETILTFADAHTLKPCRPPEELVATLDSLSVLNNN